MLKLTFQNNGKAFYIAAAHIVVVMPADDGGTAILVTSGTMYEVRQHIDQVLEQRNARM